MILQLNPLIELDTEKGRGYAMFLIDYGMDQDLYFVVVLNDSGEIWTLPNNKVKAVKNYTLGREYSATPRYPSAISYPVSNVMNNMNFIPDGKEQKDTHYHGCL